MDISNEPSCSSDNCSLRTVNSSFAAFNKPVATSSPRFTNEINLTKLQQKKYSSTDHSKIILSSLKKRAKKKMMSKLEKIWELQIAEENENINIIKAEVRKKCELLQLQYDPGNVYYCIVEENSKQIVEEAQINNENEENIDPIKNLKKQEKENAKRIKRRGKRSASACGLGSRRISKKIHTTSDTENNTTRRTRAMNRNLAIPGTSRSPNQFRSPLQSRGNYKVASVTPQPNIAAPAMILRRPYPDEVAISIKGSPLLVTRDGEMKIPHLNIPLEDGRVLAVLGKDGLDACNFPELKDSKTLAQLTRLHKFLGETIQDGRR